MLCLSGSSEKQTLYCWLCLLFNTCFVENNVWSKAGFTDLNHLSAAVQKYVKSVTHVTVKMKILNKVQIDQQLDEPLCASISIHNENVRKNRDILKRLIMKTLLRETRTSTQEAMMNRQIF